MTSRVPARVARHPAVLLAAVALAFGMVGGTPSPARSAFVPTPTTCSALTVAPVLQLSGSPVDLTEGVTPVPSEGEVTFGYRAAFNTPALGVVPVGPDGVASLSTTAIPPGQWDLIADYADKYGLYAPCESAVTPVTIVDEFTTTSISVDRSAAASGETVTWTATVSPIPSGGSVVFHLSNSSVSDEQTPVAVDTSTGIATLARNDLPPGANAMYASFSLIPAYGPSQSSIVSTRVVGSTPTPAPSPTRTPVPTARPTATPTATPIASPSESPSVEPSPGDSVELPGPSPSPTPSPTPTPTPSPTPVPVSGRVAPGPDDGSTALFSAPPTALVVASGFVLLLLLLVTLLLRLLRRGNAEVRTLTAVIVGMALIAVVAAGLASPAGSGASAATRLCAATAGLAQLRDQDVSRLSALAIGDGIPHLPPSADGMPRAQSISSRATEAAAGIAGLTFAAAPDLLRDLQLATGAYAAGADELLRLYASGAAGTPDELAGVTSPLADATRDVDGASSEIARLGASGAISCPAPSAGG